MPVNTDPDIHNLIMAANMFVKRDGKLLVIKRSLHKTYMPGFVQPVGGKVDINEGPLQAAERELLEEAGLRIKNIRLEAVSTDVHQDGINNWQAFYFSGDYVGGEAHVSIDEGELLWLTPEEIKREKVLDSIQRIVDNIYSADHAALFVNYRWDEDNHAALTALGEVR
ncbi:MAG TPA: NUDIX domain-containing protein [Candidatus Saccharimonadales bacterium]|nr:NUDIX domain-containing protein [Candidatus Saccharimonadales bacterium]